MTIDDIKRVIARIQEVLAKLRELMAEYDLPRHLDNLNQYNCDDAFRIGSTYGAQCLAVKIRDLLGIPQP